MIFYYLILVFLTLVSFSTQIRRPGSRIIGGNAAEVGQFPYAAAIYSLTSTTRYFCGGALLNEQWIITSGSCVNGFTQFSILLGANEVNSTSENALSLTVDTYVLHPDFNPNTLENDIGLIQLTSPITFTDYIQPVSLPPKDIPIYAFVTALGWGQLSDGDTSLASTLQTVVLTVLSNPECRVYFGNQITDSMVCVSGTNNQGTCLGDTGGPLINYIYGTKPIIVGISSFLSGNGCETADPSGYTRIWSYLDWIKENTGII